jgi:hypothetical protein
VNTFSKHLVPTVLALSVAVSPARGESESCPPAGVEMQRASFASAIEEREPVGAPTPIVRGQDVYFFTEVSGAQGLRLLHRWTLDGQPLALVKLDIDGNRWRT